MNYFFIISFFLLLLTFNIFHTHGADDTITATKFITGDQTIVSSNGTYELGFFRTSGNSFNYYIGMWYKKVSLQTILWVANRDSPVDKFSAQLKILDGNLVILNGLKTRIWSTGIINSSSSNSVVAVLRDDGNLVLIDGQDSEPIWESFNYPTHTFSPGAKFGYNKLTKRSQMLTSWKNSEDPGVGLFSLEIDPNGYQFIIRYNGSVSVRTSGAWNGNIFSLIPEMRLNYLYNFSYIDNENETYFTYSLYDTSYLSRLVLDISGQLKAFSWNERSEVWNLSWSQPILICESYRYCGAFSVCNNNLNLNLNCNCLSGFVPNPGFVNDNSGGCVRRIDLECGKKDKFLSNSHMGLPESPQLVGSRSRKECQTICLSDCSCTAHAYNDNMCLIWNGVLMNLKKLNMSDVNGKVIHVRVSSSEFSGGKIRVVIISIVVGCILGVLALLGLVWVVIFRIRVKTGERHSKKVDGSLVVFKYKDLRKATKNFSEKLGGGGFGSVFKGTLCGDSGTFIAVKRLEGINQGEKQFRAEVSTIGTIQHVNLVRLRGFCSETNKKLLVYEYMPKGSLHSHLFNARDTNVLKWQKRYQIALGIARGLTYLHEECRDCIIHCDIKPENILLDSEFHPKVADFGLAKFFGREFSRVLTTIRGTRGYLAPEWISGVAITTKADVYSYGMMLFELVSGRRNAELSSNSEVRFFPIEAAIVTTREGNLVSLLDHRLKNIADIEEVKTICRVACWCIQDEENLRPSMGQVVQILEGVSVAKLPPMPRSLQLLFGDQDEDIHSFTDRLSNLNSYAEDLPLNTLR